MNIRDNCFLVTGGVSGLGAACTRELVGGGARVLAADVNEAAGTALAEVLGPAVRFVRTDVTSPDDVTASLDAAADHGPLRGVVQCAGILHASRIVGRDGPYDLTAFRRVIEINLIGTFNVLRLAAARLADARPVDGSNDGERGVIVNTASVAADDGQIGQASYAASKAGVAGLSLPAARELARFGIRVVAIAPGVFETPMMAALPDAARASLEAQVPFPARLGRPEEFARLVRHAIENPYLNGTTLRLDAALRMGAK